VVQCRLQCHVRGSIQKLEFIGSEKECPKICASSSASAKRSAAYRNDGTRKP
jgi:hypothetical protein